MTRTILALAAAALLSAAATADDWPQFRGPAANGIAQAADIPTEWSKTENVAWRIELPGEGWSSPIAVGDKMFVTCAVPQGEPTPQPRTRRRTRGRGYTRKPPNVVYNFEIHCLNPKTGKTIWKKVALSQKPRISKHRDNTYATETPVTDGKYLYVYFGMHGLFCYDLDGNQVWKKDLGVYPMTAGWGTASSPALYDGLLYILMDNLKESFLAALDAKTGEEKWRVARDGEPSGWGSPTVWKNKVRDELVCNGKVTRSYDPKTGKLLWSLNMNGGRASSSPSGTAEMLYVGTENRSSRGDGAGSMVAVRAGAAGDITPKEGQTKSEFVAWSIPKVGAPMASPLVYKGQLYVLDRRGTVTCYDAMTGEVAYDRERLRGARSFWASPLAADGKVFCLDDNGTAHVLAPGKAFNVVATNRFDAKSWATPAVIDGALMVRTEGYLYRIGKK